MDFGIQMFIGFLVTCATGIPIVLHKYKKYRKEGKSIKYLEFKIAIAVGMPIASILVLLSNMSFIRKLLAIILMFIAGVIYAYSLHSGRKAFRKILGLPPEDGHTGEVIKDEDKRAGGR